jgi:dihydroxy-acid dehydratase
VGHIAPEATVGGPLALLKDGDRVRIDADAKRIDMLIDDAELARRRAAWVAPPARHTAGLLAKYAQCVGQADSGAVTHKGPAEWPE